MVSSHARRQHNALFQILQSTTDQRLTSTWKRSAWHDSAHLLELPSTFYNNFIFSVSIDFVCSCILSSSVCLHSRAQFPVAYNIMIGMKIWGNGNGYRCGRGYGYGCACACQYVEDVEDVIWCDEHVMSDLYCIVDELDYECYELRRVNTRGLARIALCFSC